MMDLKESCGSQGSQESSSLRPTSWQAFTHTSTLHGLRFVFPDGRPTARRLLWAAALLACLGLLALESAERLAYFLSYPHVTSLDAVVSSSLVFPAVTICNLNSYRFSRITRNDLYHAGDLLALLDVNLKIPQPHLAEPDVLAFLEETANFTAYRPKAFSMKEFIERVGHDLNEMMLYCRYQGQECSQSDFKTVSPLIFPFKCQLWSGISKGQSFSAASQPTEYSEGVSVACPDSCELPEMDDLIYADNGSFPPTLLCWESPAVFSPWNFCVCQRRLSYKLCSANIFSAAVLLLSSAFT